MHLKVGEEVPSFYGLDHEGKEWTYNSLVGKWTILHFQTHVGDDMFRQLAKMNKLFFASNGAFQVLGVSVICRHNQSNFMNEQDLSFPVICDEDLSIVRSFGIWQPFKSYHKSYMGVIPSIFIIDDKGCVTWEKTHLHSFEIANLVEPTLETLGLLNNSLGQPDTNTSIEEDDEKEDVIEVLFEEELISRH
ncbi:redoxin domain-containing protein [Candidatus Similichlamydia epinepheli]|uniref:redoxin domain-containing protein n=1 Tax=Candidatus Similichlamydia epinepheli TaxID=1903953 RepID=UPI000D3D29AD|nr:redoxin domain-containing protein [Candidatus Similichlamydia epinepheli]